MEELVRACCIRGYHVYRYIWEEAVDEELICEWEPCNVHNHYAGAVERRGVITGCVYWCCLAYVIPLLAIAIACEGMAWDKEPLGLGRLFLDRRYLRIDILLHFVHSSIGVTLPGHVQVRDVSTCYFQAVKFSAFWFFVVEKISSVYFLYIVKRAKIF